MFRSYLLASFILFCLVPVYATAQPIDKYLEQFRVLDPELLKQFRSKGIDRVCKDEDTDLFWKVLKATHEEWDYAQKLRGKASLGFRGDDVDSKEKDQFKVDAGLELNRGSYPGEFKFAAFIGVRLKEGGFEEDVTRFHIAYDYYTRPKFELFAFGSRFSDSFLNIDQRYEVGFGAFFGQTIGRTKNPSTASSTLSLDPLKVEALFARTDKPPWYQCYAKIVGKEKAKDVNVGKILTELKQVWDDARYAQDKRYSLVRVGAAVSVFAELEQATITNTRTEIITAADNTVIEDPVSETFTLDASQRYRWTIRPTLELRPSNHWKVRLHWYFKLPIDSRKAQIPTAEGIKEVFDYRSELDARVDFSVKETEIGQPGNVTVSFEYFWLFDKAPPTTAVERAPDRLEILSAPDSHQIFSLMLSIGW